MSFKVEFCPTANARLEPYATENPGRYLDMLSKLGNIQKTVRNGGSIPGKLATELDYSQVELYAIVVLHARLVVLGYIDLQHHPEELRIVDWRHSIVFRERWREGFEAQVVTEMGDHYED